MARVQTARALAGVVGLLLVPAAAGCGGGDGADGEHPSPSGTTSTAASTATTSASTGDATTAPTSPSAPTSSGGTPAASGTTLTATGVTLHLPAGWKVQAEHPLDAAGFDPAGSTGMVYVYSSAAFSTDTLDLLARTSARSAQRTGHGADRQPDRVVDGVRGYVLSGSGKIYGKYYEFGTIFGGNVVQIAFEWRQAPPGADQVVDSVLASVQWQ